MFIYYHQIHACLNTTVRAMSDASGIWVRLVFRTWTGNLTCSSCMGAHYGIELWFIIIIPCFAFKRKHYDLFPCLWLR